MPIFLLTPQQLDASDWATSTHRKPVQVEAENESEARKRAARHYSLERRARRGESVGAIAWRMAGLVTVRLVHIVDPGIEFIPAVTPVQDESGRRITARCGNG